MFFFVFLAGLLVGVLVALGYRRAKPTKPTLQVEARQVAFDSSRDGLFITDEQHRIVDANPAWIRMLGAHRRDEVLGQRFGTLSPLSGASDPNEFQQTKRLHLRQYSGDQAIDLSCVPFEVGGRRLMLGRARDETVRVRDRAHLDQLRAAIDASSEGIFLADPKGKILYANRAAAPWLAGRPDARAWMQEQTPATRGSSPPDVTRGEGSARTVASVVITRTDDGVSVGCIRDVTAERDNATCRRAAEASVVEGQRLESLGALAGGIAHDFNNVLTGIAGFAALARDASVPARARKYLDEVITATERAVALAEKLRQFSKHKARVAVPVDVCRVISDATTSLQEILGHAISLEIDLRTQDASLLGDAQQLKTILTNLARRARDGTRVSGRFRVQLSSDPLATERRSVRLEIEDSIPIASADRARIFEPGAGTGLSLASVYGIVVRHGGTIAASASPAGGTVFSIAFPLVPGVTHETPGATDGEISAPAQEAKARVSVRDGRSDAGRVLVVDDDPLVRSLVETALSEAGFAVEAVDNGAKALERLGARPGWFGLLLTDVIMPGLSGTELVERARELAPRTPCLFMTAYSEVALPGVPCIEKPFALPHLVDRVRELLEQTRQTVA